jgi:nucleoside-diphosphate-sugar epimerase
MNILVTGGAGFIGSHLCDTLMKQGHKVLCIDNMVSGSYKNIQHLLTNYNFILKEGEVDLIDQVLQQNREIQQIYHLASPTAPDDINNNKEMTRRVNSTGTCKLLSLAERIRAKFLFVSSVKVCGECPRVGDYIFGKRIGEELTINSYGKVARLASVYGPNMAMTDSRVIPVFITKTLRKEPISLWNGGSQIDSFCYVDDIVRGLISFMNSQEIGVIEFGAPEGISIKNLAEKIMNQITSEIVVKTDENILVVDECHKVVDISRAKQLLDWVPTVSLDNGLYKTIDYFKGQM